VIPFACALLVVAAAAPAGARVQPAPTTASQPFVLRCSIAAAIERGGVPAIDWLCTDVLAARSGRASHAPIAFELRLDGLHLLPNAPPLADGVVAAGSLCFDDGPPLLFSCRRDGVEDWFVPRAFVLPASWRRVLAALEADVLDTPRSLAVAVAAAHFGGAFVDGDPRAAALQVGAASCEDATWTAWTTAEHLRVRGRSQGGLMLPAMLLAIAAADGNGQPRPLGLRAFAARDGDAAEAARQIGRSDRALDTTTLRCLLAGEDAVRLTAIDTLVRREATAELPHIVAAATQDAPCASLAAADAVRALWPTASPLDRQRTRAAIQRSSDRGLRAIDLATLAPAEPTPSTPPADLRTRALLWLACSALGLAGLWLRERARAHTA
jgi:hypothetical protein